MKLKDYLKNEIDPPFTGEQINKLINRIAFFKKNNTNDDITTYPVIRSWVNSARGISSGSKKKKKSKKRKGKKTKNLRSSKIKSKGPSNKDILKFRIKENNKKLSKEECRKILHNYYRKNKNMTEKEENAYLKYYNEKCPNGA